MTAWNTHLATGKESFRKGRKTSGRGAKELPAAGQKDFWQGGRGKSWWSACYRATMNVRLNYTLNDEANICTVHTGNTFRRRK